MMTLFWSLFFSLTDLRMINHWFESTKDDKWANSGVCNVWSGNLDAYKRGWKKDKSLVCDLKKDGRSGLTRWIKNKKMLRRIWNLEIWC